MNIKHWKSYSCCLLLCISLSTFGNSVDVDAILDKAESNLRVNRELFKSLIVHAEQIIDEEALPEKKPRLLNLQAHFYISAFELTPAYQKAVEAEQLATQYQDQLQLAEALRKQGIINFLLNFDSEAIDLLSKSLHIHRELNSEYLLNNLQSIANVYARHDTWADSLIDIGEQLVEESIMANNPYFEEQGHSFIASGLIKKGQFKEASELALQAKISLKQEYGVISYYAARAQLKLGQLESARKNAEDYEQFAKERNTTSYIVAASILKAEILLELRDDSTGIQLMLEAYNQAKSKQMSDYQEDALLQLAAYYHEQGKHQKAFQYQDEYIELKKSVSDTRQARQLAFSRARLELAQKVQEITDLQHKAQLTEQQTQFQISAIILTGSIAILMIGLYWRLVGQKRLLQSYSVELKHANEAKSQFLARMSHEIRTPINAIIGLTKLTQKQKLTKAQQNVNLKQIEESSYTLLGVINDILDFSKIEAGKLHIDNVPFELDKAVDQATRLQMLKAHEKGLELVQYIARDVPLYLKGDALRIQQVLNNLISNAVKFTHKGMVSVSVERKYSSSNVVLEFAVKDTGIGLTQEQTGRLFDSFSQADESTTRRFGGTGLGLAICKQLVELMGGEIRVESQPDVGTTFYFTIKVEEAAAAPQKQVPGTELKDLRVLVIDDLDMCRQAAAEVLLRININPDLVESGAKAIDKVRLGMQNNAPYDLVLLDWHMPDVDGIQVASIIKQEFPHSSPIIVMLSAYDVNELHELGAPLGITHFLEKPINTSKLIELITRITHAYTPKVVDKVSPPPVKEKVAPDLQGSHILLVEDDALNRKVATGYLAETRAKVKVAENGQCAIDILTDNPEAFDLVLMDVQMPVMDGFKATQIIRRDLGLTLPVVAMTANAMTGDIDKCLAVGMNAHIPKPIAPEYLYQKLADILAHKSGPDLTIQQQQNQMQVIPNLKDKRILLVEDNKLNRKVAIGLLAETHAHLTVAKDGDMALKQIKQATAGFDMVFMDIQMPVMDGITTTRKIRDELGLTIPIIAMTGSIVKDDIEAVLKQGMDAYVPKPIDSDALYAVINNILCEENKTAQQPPRTDYLDDNMGPELIKLTQIDKARAMTQLHGKANIYEGLVEDFIDMQDHIQQLEKAIESNDIKNIKLIVHTYKSGLAYIGAFALATLGKQLDASISPDEDTLSPELLSRIRLYIKAITQVTESLKSNL